MRNESFAERCVVPLLKISLIFKMLQSDCGAYTFNFGGIMLEKWMNWLPVGVMI